MKSISKLDDLLTLAKTKPPKRIAVVFADDEHTVEAVYGAVSAGIVEATVTGNSQNIQNICDKLSLDSTKLEIIHIPDPLEAGLYCCDMINQGKSHLIMKGTITTDDYMRLILNKERGLMEPGSLLSHITVFEPKGYHKLLICSDVAVIPLPNLEQKEKILKFLIDTAHKLGIEEPLCALIAPSEKPSKKIPSSADALELMEKAHSGAFPHAQIAGPMGFDLAIDQEAVDIKGYQNPVGGNADVILFPNIEAGNVFYKTATKFLKAELGAMVVGAKVPAVLSSRGDTAKTKLYSIALAAVTTDK